MMMMMMMMMMVVVMVVVVVVIVEAKVRIGVGRRYVDSKIDSHLDWVLIRHLD